MLLARSAITRGDSLHEIFSIVELIMAAVFSEVTTIESNALDRVLYTNGYAKVAILTELART